MIQKIEHTAIMAKDMDESIAFYHRMFGFQVRVRGNNPKREMAFLFHEGIPGFEIELMCDLAPGESYSVQGIVNHLAFTVDNIEEALTHYRGMGIQFDSPHPSVAIDGGKTVFFHGPNQELLQLVEPSPQRKGKL